MGPCSERFFVNSEKTANSRRRVAQQGSPGVGKERRERQGKNKEVGEESYIGTLPFADFGELLSPLVGAIRRNQKLPPASAKMAVSTEIREVRYKLTQRAPLLDIVVGSLGNALLRQVSVVRTTHKISGSSTWWQGLQAVVSIATCSRSSSCAHRDPAHECSARPAQQVLALYLPPCAGRYGRGASANTHVSCVRSMGASVSVRACSLRRASRERSRRGAARSFPEHTGSGAIWGVPCREQAAPRERVHGGRLVLSSQKAVRHAG
jgi:hypothetical protein